MNEIEQLKNEFIKQLSPEKYIYLVPLQQEPTQKKVIWIFILL